MIDPEDQVKLSDTLNDRDIEDRVVQKLIEYLRGIGADRLALEISDERFARRILESQMIIREIEFTQEFEKAREERLEDIFVNMHSKTFDHAATYNNFVITAGYAGFFAIWNFVSKAIDQKDTVLIGILLGISLLSFIGWTMINAINNQNSMAKITGAIIADYKTRAEKIEAIQKEELAVQLMGLRLAYQWRYWFLFSIISGFAAGIILLILLFSTVVGAQISFAGWIDSLFRHLGF